MTQKIKLAFRNLNRNRRRSILSALAISIGLALLMLIASVLRGEMSSSIEKSISLVSGHIQIRSSNYIDSKASLKWADLVADPQKIIADIQSVPQINALIKDITPRLYASAIISSGTDSLGVQVLGIDPAATANNPFITGLTQGAFITADDASGVVISQLIADKLKMKVGDSLNLLVNTSNGDVVQQDFTIRGLYTTHTPSYDESTILMPLAKAQAITSTQNHASTIFVLLKDRSQTDAVASAIQGTGYQVKTWMEMNQLMIDTESLANSFMVFVYLIVLVITATVIVNTLIMSVFERTREIGILSALGWKSRDIMGLFMTEATMIALGGIAFGIFLGRFVVLYFEKIGIGFGNLGLRNGFLLGERLYGVYAGSDVVTLSIIAFVVTMLASLYPAFLAAHLEPIDALHGK